VRADEVAPDDRAVGRGDLDAGARVSRDDVAGEGAACAADDVPGAGAIDEDPVPERARIAVAFDHILLDDVVRGSGAANLNAAQKVPSNAVALTGDRAPYRVVARVADQNAI